ncbi:MAG: hypothetical protein ACKV2Q_11530 [Planctomycetaceae bacterium]
MTPKNEKLAVQLRSVPQQVILAMTGKRQSVELQRIATKWGIPIAGRTVDLFAVLRAVCDFLAERGPMLSVLLDETTDDPDTPLMVELLKARIAKLQVDSRLAELRLAERQGRLRDAGLVATTLELMASRTRSAAERARRTWGEAGYQFIVDLVADFDSDLRAFIGNEREKRKDAASAATAGGSSA